MSYRRAKGYWSAVAANYGRETEFVLYRGLERIRIQERARQASAEPFFQKRLSDIAADIS